MPEIPGLVWNPRETDLSKIDVTKLDYTIRPRKRRQRGTFVDPVRNPPRGVHARCEEFHGDGGACDTYTDTKLWMPGPIVLVGHNVDCGYNVVNRKSSKSGRYVHDHEPGVRLFRRAEKGERPTRTLKPPRECFVLGNWLGCTYDDGDGEQELMGSSRVKACTDNGRRLFAIHSTKGCLYVISGGSFRIRDWMYD
jgi:hypothetical protein